MLVIRLRRAGSKNRPFFRVVVTEGKSARDGRFVEVVGHYNPRTKPETLVLDQDRVAHWVKVRRPAVRHGAHADRSDAGGGRRRGAGRVVSRARDVVEVVARSAGRTARRSARDAKSIAAARPIVELFDGARRVGTRDWPAGPHGGRVRTLAAAAAEIDGARVSVEFVRRLRPTGTDGHGRPDHPAAWSSRFRGRGAGNGFRGGALQAGLRLFCRRGEEADWRPCGSPTAASIRGRWVVTLEGVATMNEAEALRGVELRVPADAVHPLKARRVLHARPGRL